MAADPQAGAAEPEKPKGKDKDKGKDKGKGKDKDKAKAKVKAKDKGKDKDKVKDKDKEKDKEKAWKNKAERIGKGEGGRDRGAREVSLGRVLRFCDTPIVCRTRLLTLQNRTHRTCWGPNLCLVKGSRRGGRVTVMRVMLRDTQRTVGVYPTGTCLEDCLERSGAAS